MGSHPCGNLAHGHRVPRQQQGRGAQDTASGSGCAALDWIDVVQDGRFAHRSSARQVCLNTVHTDILTLHFLPTGAGAGGGAEAVGAEPDDVCVAGQG